MAPRGYTLNTELATYLGRTFDTNQLAIADLCIESAEILIDRKVAIVFKQTSPQIFTIYQPSSPLVQVLAAGPISLVSVQGYSMFGSTPVALVAGVHYEIRDLLRGHLWFPDPGDYYRLDITYTPASAVPANVKLATNVLAAHLMRPILNDEIPGLSQYSIGGEFSIAFSEYVKTQGYPVEIDMLLGIPALYIA